MVHLTINQKIVSLAVVAAIGFLASFTTNVYLSNINSDKLTHLEIVSIPALDQVDKNTLVLSNL